MPAELLAPEEGEQVLTGDESAFSTSQTAELEKALFRAYTATNFDFSIYVGKLAAGRDAALALHRSLSNPDSAVLVAVDPGKRLIEVVTGVGAREQLSDQACRLACLTMSSRFALGDIAAGLRDGVQVLAEHGRAMETMQVLHLEEPE